MSTDDATLRELRKAADMQGLSQEFDALVAERDAAVADALPAMREYARLNPKWIDWQRKDGDRAMQDPNGAHAWLDRLDAARAQEP